MHGNPPQWPQRSKLSHYQDFLSYFQKGQTLYIHFVPEPHYLRQNPQDAEDDSRYGSRSFRSCLVACGNPAARVR